MTIFSRLLLTFLLLFPSLSWAIAFDTPLHALPLYGEAKYPPDFKHLDYVNPEAPKGGEIKMFSTTSFDSLNPFILKGVTAPALLSFVFESLMVPTLDEPATMYGQIAESVIVGKNYSSAEFILRKQAAFHDGSPITADDVVFSFTMLKEKGNPAYQVTLQPIEKAEKTGTHRVKFYFKETGNRELPQIAANMPVMSKAYYTKNDFEKTTLTPPLGSGPYYVSKVDQGRSITYARAENYWGRNLPINLGQNNFDKVTYVVYNDETVALEAFKAGEYDFREEYIARNWATSYKAPAIDRGDIIKRTVHHDNPAGMQAFIFNLRRGKFADARVREAIGLTLDFEWMNKTIFYGAYARTGSYYENTPFKATGIPEGAELAVLEPYRAQLPQALFTTPFTLPVTDGSGNNRAELIRAQTLLNEAGWVIKDGMRVNKKTGEKLSIEFLLHQSTMERVVAPMRKNLARLGITASIRSVDPSQYQKRLDEHDFDMISIWVNRGVNFPGNEQITLWDSSQADIKGSENVAGIKHKVVDALLKKLINAQDLDALTATGRALDRVMLWQHYVVPHWFVSNFRIAYWNKFGIPATVPRYNYGLFTWWIDPEKEKKLKR